MQANHVHTDFPGLKVLVMDENGLVTYPPFLFGIDGVILKHVSIDKMRSVYQKHRVLFEAM